MTTNGGHAANEAAPTFPELMGASQSDAADFGTFTGQHPALLDKKLLSRFYSSPTLASATARMSWVEPDRAPFPWQHADE